MKKCVYLDYNATTPHDPEVIAEMELFMKEEFGNPSSGHLFGIYPKKAIETARSRVALLLGCEPGEIVFTSGGTESNNYAIKGAVFASQKEKKHIISTLIEHPAVLEVCRYLEKKKYAETTYLPVDKQGRVSASDVASAIRKETVLITVMHANNETGAIQPIEEIGKLARKHDILFHTDAAQSAGKIPVSVHDLGVDLLTIAGHKMYAPKGIGAIYIKNGVVLENLLHGAGQEKGRRPGTENVIQIAGLGKSCEILARDFEKNYERMKSTRDLLEKRLLENFVDIRINSPAGQRLPNTLNVSFRDREANRLLEEIGLEVAASAGAACHTDTVDISHVLKAMNIPLEYAKGTLRFSTGRYTTEEDINIAVGSLLGAI